MNNMIIFGYSKYSIPPPRIDYKRKQYLTERKISIFSFRLYTCLTRKTEKLFYKTALIIEDGFDVPFKDNSCSC